MARRKSERRRRKLHLETLEDRILCSASVPAEPPLEDAQQVQFSVPAEMPAAAPEAEATADSVVAGAPTDLRRELIFVDTGVEDFQWFADDVLAHKTAGTEIEVVLLDAQRDGVAQISEALAGRSGIDAIHFITHGTDRAVKLGATWIDADTLAANRDAIAGWGAALDGEADLLFYGCDLAASAAGRDLLAALSSATQADLAASDDATGGAALGGDWTLEYQLGTITSTLPFSSALTSSWGGTLATFTVTNTNDSGAGSLRQAILDANALAGTDTINFNIAGAGPHSITLSSDLPTISGALIIDGYTQSGASANTLGVGTDAVLRIQLDGNSLNAPGLTLGAGSAGSTIRGLSIVNFDGGSSGAGILIQSNNNTVAGNYIGIRADGTTVDSAGNDGVFISGATGNTIGGATAADRNVISGNVDGVQMRNASANTVRGNYIGTDASGTLDRGNTDDGFDLDTDADANLILNNVISGNNGDGIDIGDTGADSSANVIRGNLIGTQANGTSALGNSGRGITLGNGSTANNTVIGGTSVGEGNVIANNGTDGIGVPSTTTTGVSILGNSIYSNGSAVGDLGIDLTPGGVNANDAGDGDTGANNLQNFPVLNSANSNVTGTTIGGTLNSNANTTFRIELFATRPAVADSPNGEGERYLGFVTVTTDGSGNASFNTTLSNVWINNGDLVTATATNPTTNDTSEFAVNVTATSTGIVVVDTLNDVLDGTTTSIANLGASRGADGRVSLREAILATNNTANGGTADKIVFAIPSVPVGGAHTISLTYDGADAGTVPDALPQITDDVIIDGTTEPDFAGTPVIELNGGNYGTGFKGLELAAGSSGSTIKGLTINRFTGPGIDILGSSNHIIQGNWIGLNAAGTASSANGSKGINALNSSGLLIGGTTAAERNVISGNAEQGILFDNTDNSTISGNYIGTNAAGTADVTGTGSNTSQSGIYIGNGSSGNTIGGTSANARNVISGNNHYGLEILGSASQNNLVQGNHIGLNAAGTAAIGNTNGGMSFWGAGTGNVLGGNVAGARNVIAGSGGVGVLVGSAATSATIQGNYIGVGPDGATITGSLSYGVQVVGASTGTLIGTNGDGSGDTLERNIISGNGIGVLVSGAGTTGTVIAGNYIGTDSAGTLDRGNTSAGVQIQSGATSATVGGAAASQRNVIAGNDGTGVSILGSTTTGHTIQGNYIGTSASGNAALGNGTGIMLIDSSSNTIRSNVVSANAGDGVLLDGATADTNVIAGNTIGLGADGTTTLGNAQEGIQLSNGASGNTIGGTVPADRNVISGNSLTGILVWTASPNNTISGNYVGTNAAGTAARPNNTGITIYSDSNTIGGTASDAANVISGNTSDGIYVTGGSSNSILGNIIGLNAAGSTALANTGSGIEVTGGATLTTIGGTASGSTNYISGNSADGITITGGASGTSVLGNEIGTDTGGTLDRGNAGAGIAIVNAGANFIGGSGVGAGNHIFGNDTNGVLIGGGGADSNEVYGNQIVSNTGHGVLISNTPLNNRIGGTVAGQGNTIASNSGSGVVVYSGSTGTRIQGNAIYANAGLGIDLSASSVATDGVTANDAGDADTGGNNRQNTPVLSTAYTNGSQSKISGTLDSTASTTFRIEFFASASADPSGSGEAERYLGYVDVTTDGDGVAAFSTTLTAAVAAGEFVTATATDASGNTSEFSANVVASLPVLTVSSPSATESIDGYAVFVVAVSTPSTGAVTVNLALSNGTATGGGVDFGTAGAGNLQVSLDDGATWNDATSATINAGTWSILVRTPIVNDGLTESTEAFTLTATRTAGSTENASAIGTATIHDNNGAPIDNGAGTFAVVQGNRLYSASFDTGKVTLLTTSPYVSNATQINSLGFDAVNGIFYYTSNQSSSTNNDIYGYDARAGTHFILTTNVTTFGVTLGSAGLGGAGGDYNGGSYYFSTEGGGTSSRDQVYKVDFVAASAGRTISTITKVAEDNFSGATDFGDILVDAAAGRLYMFNAGAPVSVDEYRLNTAPTLATYVARDTLAGISQAARDRFNNLYNVSSTIRRYDPTGAGSLGAAVTLTTDGVTAFGTAADAGAFIPAEGSIGDRVWYDADTDGVQDVGESGVVGLTVRLYDDVDGDGAIDAGERLISTTLTGADGVYTFTRLLPGAYVIEVSDPTSIMLGAASTTGGSLQTANVTRIGEAIVTKDFGYEQAATLDVSATSGSYTEGTDSYAVFNVSLSNRVLSAVTLDFTLNNGTATGGGTDFGAAGPTNLQVSTDGGTSWADATSATIPAGSTSVLVRTPIVNDALDEAAENFTLTATVTSGLTANASANGAAIINDNDPAPSLSIDDITVNEATGTATFTVTLSTASGQAVSVNYATANGTAAAGSDFTSTTGTLNFAAGVTTQTISVPITNDTTFENSESFNVNLSAATNATISDSQGVGTIKDDGTGSGGTDNDTPTLAVSSPAVTEGTDTHAVFTVSLSNASTTAVSANIALANVSATGSGTDYGAGGAGNLQVSTDGGTSWSDASSVTFAAGVTSVLVRTPIVNDTLDENAETFTLTATRTAGTTTNASASGTATIADNDLPPDVSVNDVTVNEAAGTATFTVSLSAASGLAITVTYNTSNGTATAGADYTSTSGTLNFAAGVTSQTITVPILDDATFENSETFNVLLTGSTNAVILDGLGVGTIRDDGTGSGGTDNDTPSFSVSSPAVTEGTDTHAIFTVSLSNASTTAVTVNLALANVTATGGAVDYGTGGAGNLQVSTDGGTSWADASSATIAAGSTSVLVRTPIVNDTLDENAETFTLTATRTAGTTTNASAAGTATITDNDPQPSFSINDVTVNEAAGTATFTVTLNTASGLATSVNYATSNGTATSGSDFTNTSGTLNFAAGVVSQTVVVSITNDTTFENSETFNVDLSGATNATISDNQGVGTIRDDGTGSGGTDNDTPTLAVSSPSVTEGTDSHAQFTVSLSNASTTAVTFNLSLANVTATGSGTDYGTGGAGNLQVSTDGGTIWADATSATIAAGSTSVLVRTPIVNDTLDENAETFTLTATRTAGTTTNASAAGTSTITDNDPQPSFSIDDVTVNEAAGSATFTVTLNTASGLATSVAYATSSGTATSGSDFTSTSGTLNFAAGVTSQTITVPILNDTTFENSETFNVTLSGASNATISDATGVGTIRDDGTGSGGTDNDTPTLAVSNVAVTEGTDAHAVFTVSLSNASTQSTTVNLALANVSATGGGTDYGTGGAGNLQVSTDGGTSWADATSATIAAGSTSVLVRTPIVNDALDENAETFTLTATRTAGTTTNASAAGTATITDNDPTPSLTIDDVTVNEAAGTATFTVTLSAASGLPVSVNYATSSGTATSGSDFTSASGMLNFASGVVSQTIVVPITNDAIFENSETFTVTLSGEVNASIADGSGLGTIRDDGTGAGGTDDDTPTFTVSSPSVVEGTDAHAVFTVSLSNASTTPVSFSLALANASASGGGTDYGTGGAGNLQVSTDGGASWADASSATIAAGSTSVLVRTPIVNDALDEAAETFTLTATRTAGTTTNASAAGTATITDDDSTPTFSIDDVTVNEAAGTAIFTVTLSAPSGQATSVNYATTNGTAVAGSDYIATSGTLNFAAGVVTQTVVVPIANDATFEGLEDFMVLLSGATNAGIADPNGVGSISDDGTGAGGTDNDTPTLAVNSVAVTEGTDPHAVFTVSLSNASTTAVTVNLALADGSATGTDYGPALEVSTDGGTVWSPASAGTIAAGSTSILVRTPITNDALNEPTETFTLTATRTAGTTTNASASGTATITDDDGVPVLSINDVTVNEAAGTATFTVTLSAPSAQTVSVNYATSNGTATAGSDYTATSGPLTFAPGVTMQTITVPILNDATFETSESFTVTLSGEGNATLADATGVGTIRDDGTGNGGTDDDTPTLAVSNVAAIEGTDTHAIFNVTLSNASTAAVTADLALANGTATAADYGPALEISTDGGTSWGSGTSATFVPSITSVLVRTPIVNDALDEPAETLTLTATRTAGTTTNASAIGTATIADDDATPTLSIGSVTVNEAAGTATFTVTLSAASGQAVSANFATADGTALAGSDYTATSGTLNFAAGATTRTIVVPITNDALFESSENFTVTLSAPGNATIATGTGTGTIRDDGTGSGGTDDDTPTFSVSNVAVTEGVDAHAVFTVSLSNAATSDVDLSLALNDGTATSVGDFIGGAPEISLDGGTTWTSSATATVAAGTTSLLVRTAISDDAISEAIENFTLHASLDSGVAANTDATGTATITDNDGTPALSIDDVTVNEAAGTATFIVSLSGASALSITADFATVAGTASAGADYTSTTGTVTFAPGELVQAIVVPIVNDVTFEGSEGYSVMLSNVVNATISDGTGIGTILDDGTGAGGTDDDTPTLAVSSPAVIEGADAHAVFTVSLSNPSTQATTVNLTLANGSATGADYGPALEVSTDGGTVWSPASAGTIAAGSTSILVRTPITDDALDEPAETFTLTATRTAGSTTNASAVGTATIADDDATPSLSIDSVTVNEAAGTATFTVTLSAPSGQAVSVGYATSNGTATAGSDYTAAAGTLSFAAGVVSQTIVVAITDDAIFENSESFNVTLSAPSNATIATGTGTGTIRDDGTGSAGTDDDTPTLAVSSPAVIEGTDAHAVFTVSLSNPSTQATTVNLTLANGSATGADYGPALEVSTDGGTVWSPASAGTIAAGSTSILVRTPIIDDALDEPAETFTLTATRTAGTTTNASAVGTATIADDDATPSLSIDSVTVNEAAGTATFTVTLSAASGQAVSVGYATSNGTATVGSDYTAVAGTLNFAAGVVSQTIVVAITDDAIFENSESFNVTLNSPTNATIASGTGLGTIRDDGTGTGGTDDDTPTLAVSSPIVVEGSDPYALFAVSIGNTATAPISFNLALANGSATGADYGPGLEVSTDGGTMWTPASAGTIAAGSTSVLVRTPIADDALDEAAETFTLTATRTAGPTTNASAVGTATITDDDATPSLSIDSVTVNEAAGTATFTVTLSAPSGQAVSVGYATSAGTALAGSDYTAAAGTLNFAAGVVSQTIVVAITDDAIFENSETFNVTLSAPTNATIATGTGTGTIRDDGTGAGGSDDDTPTIAVNNVSVTEGTSTHATFNVTLSHASTTPVTADLALANGSATATDYGAALEISTDGGATWSAGTSATFLPSVTSVLARTPIVDDALNESSETFTLTATRAAGTTTNASATGTATISDNDGIPTLSIDSVTVNEAAGTATFTVTLNAPSGQPVGVNYATGDGTALAGSDYTAAAGALNFAAGVVSQTITVPIANDAIFENSETFNVTLSAPTNATIANGTGTGTIRDDGTGAGGTDDDTPTLAVSSPSVTEGTSTHAIFTVSLSNPATTAVTVNLALGAGTATAADYVPALEVSTDGGATWSAASAGTIAAGSTSLLVRTPITDDALDETAETFTLTATRTSGTTVNVSATGTATITDDDATPSLTIDDVTVNEAAGTLVFTVTLSAPSGQTVTVDFATADGTALAGADYTATSGTLTFAPGTVTQTISVPILNDALFENSEAFALNLSNPTNATIADAIGAGTIRDDGAGGGGVDNDTPTLAVGNVSVLEGTDTHAVFAITLSNPSTTAVAVNLALANGTASAADYGPGLEVSTDGGATWSATSSAVFSPGSTSVLARTPLADDAISESPETFTLTATVASGTTTNAAAIGIATT